MVASRHALSRIPGQYIVEAMDRLPPCGPAAKIRDLDIDVPFWGRFRVTFTPIRQAARGLPRRWIWVATSAERLPDST